MLICKCVSVYMDVYLYMCVYMCVYIYECIYVYICVCRYVCRYVCIYIYMNTYMYTYEFVCLWAYVYITPIKQSISVLTKRQFVSNLTIQAKKCSSWWFFFWNWSQQAVPASVIGPMLGFQHHSSFQVRNTTTSINERKKDSNFSIFFSQIFHRPVSLGKSKSLRAIFPKVLKTILRSFVL